jgi:hypothetical protein
MAAWPSTSFRWVNREEWRMVVAGGAVWRVRSCEAILYVRGGCCGDSWNWSSDDSGE